MRRLRRPSRRQGGQVLHHACRHGGWTRNPDHRGLSCRRRAAASDAGSFPRASWPAMWLLHAGYDHDRDRYRPSHGSRALRPHHPRRARRQSVPVHRLPEHRDVDRRRRQGDGQIRSRLKRASPRSEIFGTIPMYEFKYHRPATVRQAANLLVKNEDAKVIAGGHTLVPVMKQRLASPPHLVDLSHIEGLDGIEMKGRSLVIGATAKHADVASSAIVGEAIPALAELAGMIGDPAVRNKGTIGGSLANNDPTADYPAACLALGATIVTNKRRLKADEFFKGLFSTALEADEIITRVMFPLPKKAAYVKFRNQASRYALVGVFVAKRPSDVRVAVTGAGSDGVFRLTAFEDALKKRFSAKALDGLTVPPTGLNGDLHGSAEYRAHLIAVLARRAVEAATAKS